MDSRMCNNVGPTAPAIEDIAHTDRSDNLQNYEDSHYDSAGGSYDYYG